jgi:hypothetical protein
MKVRSLVRATTLATLAAVLALPSMAVAIDYPDRQGLVAVDGDSLDQAWLRPGVDLSRFEQVLIEPATLSFKSDWRRKMNLSERSLARQLSDRDVAQIDQRTRDDFDRVFAEQLARAGYQIVDSGGPDVLVLKPLISELYLNDPAVEGVGRSEIFVTHAGQATLTIEARDGASGELLGATIDHRETRNHNVVRRSSAVFTQSDLRELFADWGKIVATDLHELHERPALSQVD